MTKTIDSLRAFPIRRAQLYPHGPTGNPVDEDRPIAELDIDHLTVDVSVVEVGTVTIAGSSKNMPRDIYGVELDLSPSDARSLGHQLIEAAAQAEERPSDATAS